jgi:hypothetical protein
LSVDEVDDPVNRDSGGSVDPFLPTAVSIQGRVGNFDQQSDFLRPRVTLDVLFARITDTSGSGSIEMTPLGGDAALALL